MKKLILLRHAKSGWDDPVPRDFDRPLNAKGLRAARAIGHFAQAAGIRFDTIVASPALRVTETLAEFGNGFGEMPEPGYDRRIYLASAQTLLEVIQGLDDKSDAVLMVGHNPGLEDLVFLLVPEGEDDAREQVEEKYPTASIAEITLGIDHWSDAEVGSGTLDRFTRPRDLDPAFGPDATG
ncbi:MAG TPA: histidine phosphatase family protein [Candidatus Dormibacteraeota bacterium]|nr:histidine phosphatase family protein [Candidatus Dormibacteraeota bacterium]